MFRRSGSGFGLATIFLILIFCSSNINWGKDRWKDIVIHDAFAYYSYLPAIFIYQDLSFNFIGKVKEKYQSDKIPETENFLNKVNGSQVNKYYCGTALAQFPFFAIAHLLSGWFNYDQDGYSKLYMVCINLAGIFYLMLGLFYLRKLLYPLKLSEATLTLLLIATVFGTPIFYYTIIEPGMSHIYSFALVTLFLYFGRQYFLDFATWRILTLAGLLGLITIIRPINLIAILLLLFAAGSFENFKTGIAKLLSNKQAILSSISIFLIVISLQFGYYKITTGNWIVYSYGEEGFNFLKPHFIDILFSYKKGLFLYTPLFLIALLSGGYCLFSENKYRFFSLIGFLFFLTYLLSSWWSWWYGGSFSGRPFLEFSALFVYLLAIAFKKIRNPILRKSYIMVVVFLIMICQFQTYQYRKGFIHWENMTKEQYWNVFLNPKKLLR